LKGVTSLTQLCVVQATPPDLSRYIDLLEELADWLHSRGIDQWPRGRARSSPAYYGASIDKEEVHLAFDGDELAGALRLLMSDPIVWPEFAEADAVYVYNLAVRRAWTGRGLGRHLLDWAEQQAAALGRRYVRLDCFPGNTFLRRYYEDAGFIERGEVDAIYPEPVGLMHLRRYEKQVRSEWR
jgi:ribosomal protein S18 acetylase RimI-like enzyme